MTTHTLHPDADAGNFKSSAHDLNTIAPFGSKRDVAAMLKMSVRSVDNFLAAGMPHMKIGKRRCRFDLPVVREWMLTQYGIQRRGGAQ
jgi:hypothetical protein